MTTTVQQDTTTVSLDMQALVRALAPSIREEPDGSMILVDEATAYVRSDQTERAQDAPGDWWKLDGADGTVGAGPLTLGEILDDGPRAVDDPPRTWHTYALLFTAEDVLRIVGQVARAAHAPTKAKDGGTR